MRRQLKVGEGRRRKDKEEEGRRECRRRQEKVGEGRRR